MALDEVGDDAGAETSLPIVAGEVDTGQKDGVGLGLDFQVTGVTAIDLNDGNRLGQKLGAESLLLVLRNPFLKLLDIGPDAVVTDLHHWLEI